MQGEISARFILKLGEVYCV